MSRRSRKKLGITRETLTAVGGATWHRTTLRCHQTYGPATCGCAPTGQYETDCCTFNTGCISCIC